MSSLPYCVEPITLSEHTASGKRVRSKILTAFAEQNAAFQEAEEELERAIESAHRVTKTSEPPPALRVEPPRSAFDSLSDG